LSLRGAIAGENASYEIVGVVGNIRLSGQVGYRVFVPITQASPYWIDLVLRADNRSVLPAVRQALRGLNPDLLLENESSFQTIISNSLALERAQSGFAGLTGVLSVIVSGGGLYALVALMVAQRRRELGIRLALGSTPRQLFRDTLWRGLRMVAAGIVLGEIAAFALVRLLGSRVFGLGSADAAAYAGAAALILVVAFVAISIPARQVIGIDPLLALRSD
jgi:ABC-type antimicrobial peptide transport system permease subunit